MSSYVIEQVDCEPLLLGEGPHWDAEKKRLYYVDIPKSTMYCYNPESKTITKAVVGNGDQPVSLIIPVENEIDKFVISYGTDIATVKWDGVNEHCTDLEIIASTPNPNTEMLRINDGKCSPRGILFAGTMEINFTLEEGLPGKGAFYSFKAKEVNQLFDNVRLSNGLAWSADEKKLYYNDSLLFRVDSFDYDAENLKLSNRRTVFDFKANQIPGFPDGMTIDLDGNLWIAVYHGSRVLHIDPATGILLNTIQLPTSCITSVTFGGKNLNELYVTSASGNIDKDKDSNAGCIFKVTQLKTTGSPGNRAKI